MASLMPAITSLVTSARVRTLQRTVAGAARRLRGARPAVRYFHQHGDPYSALVAPVLPELARRYGVTVEAHAVSPPDAAAAPEAERLAAYAVRDAARLARRLALSPADDPAAYGIPPDTVDRRAAGDALRARLGHYLGATLFFEGEWYWGLDRLADLEVRLAAIRGKALEAPIAPRLEVDGGDDVRPQRPGVTLELFLSFRSPYSYLALPRAERLARRYGAMLNLRFVLPMVMRGLPVPAAKRLYIVRDCAREAERLGLPFGRICDPVGAPTERGLAVLHHAIGEGRGAAFALSFLQGVFAEGVDAGAPSGLARLAARAGIEAGAVSDAIADPSWRDVAERNRAALFEAGLWGVPSMRVVTPEGPMAAHWGQDRLWAAEEDLRAAVGEKT